jgi:hypothetical protein
MLLASLEMLGDENISASSNSQLFLMGYSQGAWATLSVLKEIESAPEEDLNLKAASCGAGAYDLKEMTKHVLHLSDYADPFYFPYFIESHRRNGFINDSLSLFFNEPYKNTIPGLFTGSLCNSEVNAQLTTKINELFTPLLINEFETSPQLENLRTELSENSIEAWNLSTPLMLYHSTGDKTISSEQTQTMYNSFLEKGVNPELLHLILIENDTIDHSDAVMDWGIKSISWFNSLR